MIVGVTGSYCSGKDTIAEYLVNAKGFIHRSLSDELREEMKRRDIAPTRENLIVTGTDLREKEGFGVLAKRVMSGLVPGKNYVITSIRHPAEIVELKKCKDFFLVDVDAPAEVRFERMKKRNRPGDPDNVERFLELEKKESQEEGAGQQLAQCSRLASLRIINDSENMGELHSKIEKLLGDIEKNSAR